MIDYMDLVQTTPCDEKCIQVGDENYFNFSRVEAFAYIAQLRRTFGGLPKGSRFTLVRCPHDAGTYLDIRYWYDDEEQSHIDYLNNIERGCEKWDEESMKELEDNSYPLIARVIKIRNSA